MYLPSAAASGETITQGRTYLELWAWGTLIATVSVRRMRPRWPNPAWISKPDALLMRAHAALDARLDDMPELRSALGTSSVPLLFFTHDIEEALLLTDRLCVTIRRRVH